MNRISWLAVLICLLVLLPLVGCQGPQKVEEESPFVEEAIDYILLVVLDVSGSFEHELRENGRAYPFLMRLVDRFFRDRLGNNDRIIIAQISNKPNALLFDSSPRVLREKFSTPTKLMDFVLARADPNGSRVFDSIADGLTYMMTCPGVMEKKARTAAILLTDMEDNWPNGAGSKTRLAECLSKYATTGGAVGIYWVEPSLVAETQLLGRKAGLKHFVVESGIREDPPLPFGN